jgi:hypothetical protein
MTNHDIVRQQGEEEPSAEGMLGFFNFRGAGRCVLLTPTATTTPTSEQHHSHNILLKDALVYPKLSFLRSSTRTSPLEYTQILSPAINSRRTSNVELPYLPRPSSPNQRIRHVARNQYEPPSRLIAPRLPDITLLPTTSPPSIH